MSEVQKSKKREAFEEARKDYTKEEMQMELLYITWLTYHATEKSRENLATIVWIFAVSIGLGILALVFMMLAA